MALPTKLHFHRYEFKYVLDARLRRDIEGELAFFMDLDPYVADQPQARYHVRSLYFDDPAYTHYYNKIDGQLTRAKFRLRTYTTDPREPCATFLEIKGRHNNMVFKHRALLRNPAAAHPAAGGDDIAGRIAAQVEPGEVLQHFLFDRYRKRIRPVMLVDYKRRPLVSRLDPEFRVTFDDELTATPTRRLFPAPHDTTRRFLPGRTIMEVKFRYHIPSWFHRILQSYELRNISISKICQGIETFDLTPAL